jgi:AcrR family transcriptional regulator
MNEADPRVRRTRKLIFDAFVALLQEKGFHAVSVQEVAARATVNRATFYAHFVDKYDLLDQMVSEWFRETLNQRQLTAAPFTLDNLQRLVVTVLETTAEFHHHCLPPGHENDSSIEARVQRELTAFIRDWLARSPANGHRDQVSAEATASVVSWAIFGAALDWSRNPNGVTAVERSRQVVNLLARGLLPAANCAEARRKPTNG